MFKKYLLLVIFCVSFIKTYSQGRYYNWYFGEAAGITFPGGINPVPLLNGAVWTSEGSASISDNAGNLLFYTDGTDVWNKNHAGMTNGSGLKGHFSSSQTALIVKKPGNNTIYYIFTVSAMSGGGTIDGFMYTEVDMSLSGGLGAVTSSKNVLIYNPTTEKLTATMHCNGVDVWVVTQDYNSNNFRACLVTSSGVSSTPVVSSAGFSRNTVYAAVGYMKFNKTGTRLAAAYSTSTTANNGFELFDFDRTTGIVSNPWFLPISNTWCSPYGVEFSPDGSKLYANRDDPGSILFQWNLNAGSLSAVQNSSIQIAVTDSMPATFGALQLGPDDKIYMTRANKKQLAIIHNPNALGAACNFTLNGLHIGNGIRYCYLGLPNNWMYDTPACTTGIKDESEGHSQNNLVFPNPNSGSFELSINKTSKVEIFDLCGKKLFEENYTEGKYRIDLTEQVSGIYFLEITSGVKVQRTKFVVK